MTQPCGHQGTGTNLLSFSRGIQGKYQPSTRTSQTTHNDIRYDQLMHLTLSSIIVSMSSGTPIDVFVRANSRFVRGYI